MKKIHKISYAEIFSDQFSPEKIDGNLRQMELDEKLFLLDNIIDYLYYNFKSLRDNPQNVKVERKDAVPVVNIKPKLSYE